MSSLVDLLQPSMAQPNSPSGFVQGVVTENAKKDFYGMVKVELLGWEKQKNISDWIPLLHFSAGKDYGSYWIPEIGDIVLIGFMAAGYLEPFVLGCFYPTESEYRNKQFEEKNFLKILRTKGGIEIAAKDEKDKQFLTVKTPKELSLKLEDEKELITISDKKGETALQLDCKKGEVQIASKAALKIKAGKCEIELDGNSGKLSIKCAQLDIKADQTAKIASGQMLTMEGGVLKIEGKQTATLKGGAMTEVSGGMLKLN